MFPRRNKHRKGDEPKPVALLGKACISQPKRSIRYASTPKKAPMMPITIVTKISTMGLIFLDSSQ